MDDPFTNEFESVEEREGATPFKITLWVLFGLAAVVGTCCTLLVFLAAVEDPTRDTFAVLPMTLSPLVAAGLGYALLQFAPRFDATNWGIAIAVLLSTLALVLIGFGGTVALGYTEPNLMIPQLQDATLVCFVPGACLLLLAAPIYFLPLIQKRL